MENSNKKFYEKLSRRKLTDQEAFKAKSNFTGFFDLLLKTDRRNKKNMLIEYKVKRDDKG